jgi:hypothetical protein
MRLDVRRALIYTHRWLGIFGSVLFVAWFASGLVMMYARMPLLTAGERVARLAPVDLADARMALADGAPERTERVRVSMLAGRPVYRFLARGDWTTVFADTGQTLERLTPDQAIDLARRFAPEHTSTVRYDAYLTDPDQWTLEGEVRRRMPLHRIALGDADDTHLYVSVRSGEAVMKTTAAARRLGYLGAVVHWIYFTPLRRQATLWSQLIIWASIAGCVLCLSGLVWGVWRFSWSARYRLKREQSHTPYAGLMRWHHYAGLGFGVVTFTWIFSGLLSMDPWNWSPSTSPTRQQREAMAGGALRLEELTLARLRSGVARAAPAAGTSGAAREIEIVGFRGEPFLLASTVNRSRPDRATTWLVSVLAPERGTFDHFDTEPMLAGARAAMPDATVADAAWLEAYDSYYYDRDGSLPLPVLRVRFSDPPRTWLYVDAGRGAIVRREERLSRLNRWLYHGLHSLDFPFLYYDRPLWDVVVIALSGGGLVLSASTLMTACHRLRRHGRRLARGSWRLQSMPQRSAPLAKKVD